MAEQNTFTTDKSTPFWDTALSIEKRIDWLLEHMTVEEKLKSMPSFSADIDRLGIPGLGAGGEAAHGVEGRNDQNGLGTPDISTSFPQPIGMSATWDTTLIKKAGEVTGTEARVIYHRHPRFGLLRWAPTVDLERDPRWGRNEEGYGEDPYLTGEMASAYIQGMQGDDPYYLRCAATLKHFYANNMEKYRCFVNTTIDPRNKQEYYLDVFRRCIVKGKVQGIMTAYNGINGVPGILNPEVKDILKEKYGLTHAVSDGSATVLVVKQHHFFGIHAETVAAALKAGIDGFSDRPENVNAAIREAYELKLIEEADLDQALRNMLRTKLRLGVYDAVPNNPYDLVTEEDICSKEACEISLQMAKEAIVLLKNEDILPLPTEALMNTALIGPVADEWYMDWYGGRPPYTVTTKAALQQISDKLEFVDGKPRVQFLLASEKGKSQCGLTVMEDETVSITDHPDIFILEDWGEESFCIKCERTGKYLNCAYPEQKDQIGVGDRIYCAKEETFEWFVHELFHVLPQENGLVKLSTRFDFNLQVNEANQVVCMHENLQEAIFAIEYVQDGIKQAVQLAKTKDQVIMVLGCNPMINAKEEIDRETIALPPAQEALFEAVYEVNPNIILVLQCNYPYALGEVAKKAKAILWTATGGQDMGTAVAQTLIGAVSPAGRLNQTWYLSDEDLPDMNDYDIIGHPRTYRYFEKPVLYPFGYGLGYTSFAYEHLQVQHREGKLSVSFQLTNQGTCTSDEVVQVYGIAPKGRVKKPLKQLLAFERVKDMAPGEIRKIELVAYTNDLQYYDVISQTMLLEEGEYTFFVGGSSADMRINTSVFIKGVHPGKRNMLIKNAVDHFDEQEHVELTVGHLGYTAAQVMEGESQATLVYRDCQIPEGITKLRIHMYSDAETTVQIKIAEKDCGSFTGDTIHYQVAEPFMMGKRALRDWNYQEAHRKPQYTDVVIPLENVENSEAATIMITIGNGAKICYFNLE